MSSDSPRRPDPDPHYSPQRSIPEGNARRWAVLVFFGFWLFVLLFTLVALVL